MSLFEKLTDRVLALLGLDFDLSFDALTEPFHAITPAITLGACPRLEQRDDLRERGITHVVSCLPPEKRGAVDFLEGDFETLFLPLHDGMHEDITAHFPAFFALIDSLGRGERALVHCEVGVSRSASLVIAQVMRSERLRFFEAYKAVRLKRAQVLPNIGFATQLYRFERTLFPAPRTDGPTSLARYLHEICKVPVELEVLAELLAHHDHDALPAIKAIFGGEVPRVVQGVRR